MNILNKNNSLIKKSNGINTGGIEEENFELTIRRNKDLSLNDLIKAGFITKKQSKFLLNSLIEKHLSIVILGNMCSGKTSLLRALVEEVKKKDKERHIIDGKNADERLLISARIFDDNELILLDNIQNFNAIKNSLNNTCCICVGYKTNYFDTCFIEEIKNINRKIIVVELNDRFNNPNMERKVLKCYELNKQ